MSKSKAPTPIREVDYEAIESALLQSARGRWFLAEFSNRNRSADTRMLLDAISRLEATMLAPKSGNSSESRLRHDLIEMSEAIAQTRKEISAMRPANEDDSKFANATEELDAIVQATEKATSDILEAAEDIQETAWQMREKGADAEACDRLDARATDIYTACSFQDLTGQRTSKVVAVLRYLENRVRSMIDIWGLDDIEVLSGGEAGTRPDAHLLNGPARQGEGVDQDSIDQMLDSGAATSPAGSDASMDQQAADTLMDDPVMDPAPGIPAPEGEMQATPPTAAPPAPEVQAAEFSPPEQLSVGDLDQAKTQALFS